MKLYILRSGSPVHAIALWPFILISKRYKGSIVPPSLIRHELIHHRQQLEMLLIPFYLWYLSEYAIRYIRYRNRQQAYRGISFEREAYQHDGQPDYLQERPFWAFLKYL